MKIWLARLGMLLGAAFCLLGMLWLLQGAGLIHLKPVACVANCQPLTSPSVTWQLIGGVTATVSVAMIVFCYCYTRRVQRPGKSQD